MRRLNDCGDTIVEVLLAILVVGTVLAGAYVTANQSLKANRASQERSEALKFVEGQLEQLKASIATASTQPGYFCINAGTIVTFNSPPPPLDSDDWANYKPGCSVGTTGRYHLSIMQSPANSGTYVVQSRWDQVNGGQKQQITMRYRVFP